MKRFIPFLLLFAFGMWINNASAQCTPDPTCTDLLNPGEICPEDLPNGMVGVPYYEVVTIIPPYEADLGLGTVTIHHIEITGVDNIPPGLIYEANAVDMFPYNSYCVLISGTPTTVGVFNLGVKVDAYIEFAGNPVFAGEQTDDTSLVITIDAYVGIKNINNKEFSLLGNIPNPFYTNSRIGFYNNISETVELKIFNILGEEVYSEKIRSIDGENYFRFSGNKLNRGIFIYSVTNGRKVFTKQLIKNS